MYELEMDGWPLGPCTNTLLFLIERTILSSAELHLDTCKLLLTLQRPFFFFFLAASILASREVLTCNTAVTLRDTCIWKS